MQTPIHRDGTIICTQCYILALPVSSNSGREVGVDLLCKRSTVAYSFMCEVVQAVS